MSRPEHDIDERTLAERSRIEDRALWLYFLHDEMRKEIGASKAEEIARRAVRRFGELKDDLAGNPGTPGEWIQKHAIGSNPAVFEKEIPEGNAEERCFRMHYCALQAAWEKLGLSDEEKDLLCDIAMDGDRARCKGGVMVDVTERMCDRAKNPGYCRVVVKKKRQ